MLYDQQNISFVLTWSPKINGAIVSRLKIPSW